MKMIQAISQACVSLVQSVPIGSSVRLREMSHFVVFLFIRLFFIPCHLYAVFRVILSLD
jgi:hypothetical protein